MHTQPQQQTPAAAALAAAFPVTDARPVLLTVEQFAARNPAFSPAALRNLIFKAEPRHCSQGQIPGNGLLASGAIVRLGRRVLLDEYKFFGWVTHSSKLAPATD